jgi:hypothetical protein
VIVSLLFRCWLEFWATPFPSLLEIELQESSGPGCVFFGRLDSQESGVIKIWKPHCRHKQLAYFCSWGGGYYCI